MLYIKVIFPFTNPGSKENGKYWNYIAAIFKHILNVSIYFILSASFLIPYFIILAAEGMPLYYMELCLGQRLRNGSIGVWNIVSPYLDGLGFASVVICIMVCLYYNVILSWCLIYLVNSFKSPLPWSQCPKTTIKVGENVLKSLNQL